MYGRCDKEIGHWSRGWTTCKQPAAHVVQSTKVSALYLDYCAAHVPSVYQHGTDCNCALCYAWRAK